MADTARMTNERNVAAPWSPTSHYFHIGKGSKLGVTAIVLHDSCSVLQIVGVTLPQRQLLGDRALPHVGRISPP